MFDQLYNAINNRNDVRVRISRYRAYTRDVGSDKIGEIIIDDILVRIKHSEEIVTLGLTFDSKSLRQFWELKEYINDIYGNKEKFSNDYLIVDIYQRSTFDNMHFMIPKIALIDDFPEDTPSCTMLFNKISMIMYSAEGMFEN